MQRKSSDIRTQNTTAILALANIVKSSLGPVGLDKMIVDNVGDVTITNDGATILRTLEIEHPAAKVLVQLSELQDKEVGDGTTSVVIIAAELLKNALDLIKQHVHPTTIILGYKRTCRLAVKYIQEHLTIPVEQLGEEALYSVAKTTIASKAISTDLDFFSSLAVHAIQQVKTLKEGSTKATYPIKAINILKAHGKGMRESRLVPGIVLNCTRACQGMPHCLKNVKIACIDFGLQRARLRMGIEVQVKEAEELEGVREGEITIVKQRIEMMLNGGANVILTTGGIDDLCLKYFVEKNAIGVRRVKRDDLRHIAKATGATMLLNLANLEGEEAFDPACLGEAEEICEEHIADDDAIFIKNPKTTKACSILLRGPNDYMLDEMDRSIHDALCALKRTLESDEVVVGGGAVDGALNVALERFSQTVASREQLAIDAFAKALLVIPKTLAVNAAADATELVARLRAAHAEGQLDEKNHPDSKYSGLNLVTGQIVNNLKAGVLEPSATKIKALQFATDAAVSILRVDDYIEVAPQGGEDQQGGQ
nr:T-complex protein 1 subunit alpha [Paratrimastix eleionoma]